MNRLRSKKVFFKCFQGDLKLFFVFIMKTFFSMQGCLHKIRRLCCQFVRFVSMLIENQLSYLLPYLFKGIFFQDKIKTNVGKVLIDNFQFFSKEL